MEESRVHLRRKYRHKISSFWKLMILLVLLGMSGMILILLMGRSQQIAQRSLIFNPLFTFFDKQFQLNGLDSKRFYRQMFQRQMSSNKGKISQKLNRIKDKHKMVNIVYQNATQSYHFDNWLFLGQYISFLLNRYDNIIQRKIMTQDFFESYQSFKLQKQTNPQGYTQKAEINQINSSTKNMNLLQFSESFQKVLEKDFFTTNQLEEKKFVQKIKIILDQLIQKSYSFFFHSNPVINKKINTNNNIWIIWILNSNIQDQSQIKLYLKKLQKEKPKDKFVILSFFPILSKNYKIIHYQPNKRSHFNGLVQKYLNLTSSHINLISKHYKYSLLSLSKDIRNEQSFSLDGLIGGRFNYCDLSKIPNWVLEKVQNLCQGQKIKTLKILQQQEKIHFYRLGLYKISTLIFWKDKNSKKNYEFQTGLKCKKIPIFHQQYSSLLQISQKNIFMDIFKKFKETFQQKKNKRKNQMESKNQNQKRKDLKNEFS